MAPDGETSGTPYARGAVADPPAHLVGGAMGVLKAHTVSSLSNLLRRRKHQVRTFRPAERLCGRNFRVRALIGGSSLCPAMKGARVRIGFGYAQIWIRLSRPSKTKAG